MMVTRKEYFNINEDVPPEFRHYPEYREIFEEYVPHEPSIMDIIPIVLFVSAFAMMIVSFAFGGLR